MKVTKKLIPAVAMLMVSVIVLASASFAWFSMSRKVTATGMNVTVVAPTNLWISNATDGTYSNTAANTTTNVSLFPASSISGQNLFLLQDGQAIPTSGNIQKESVIVSATEYSAGTTLATRGYIDYVYYIKTEAEGAVKVTLDTATTTISNDAKLVDATGATATKTYNIGKGRTEASLVVTIDGATKAVTTDYTYNTDTGVLTLTEGAATASNEKAVVVKDSDSIKPVRLALLTGTSTKTVVGGVYNIGGGTYTTATKAIQSTVETSGVYDHATFADVVNFVTTANDNYVTSSPATSIFEVAAGETATPITVRVWFEGEDTKCKAGVASKADFTIQVGFKVVTLAA